VAPVVTNCIIGYGCALVLIVSSACDLAIGLGLYILLYKASGEVTLYQVQPEKHLIEQPLIYKIKEKIGMKVKKYRVVLIALCFKFMDTVLFEVLFNDNVVEAIYEFFCN
jgi:hypothetical protein